MDGRFTYFLVVCVLAVGGDSSHGGDPVPLRRGPTDGQLQTRVENALAADAVVGSRSLVVSVVDGVAVVGGPVGSTAETARVKQVLAGVPGLAGAKVSCWVPLSVDRLKAKMAEKAAEASPIPPLEPRPDDRPIAQPTVHRDRPTPMPSAYSPLPSPLPPAPKGPPQFPTIPPLAVPVVPQQDVATAADELRRRDDRYAGLALGVTSGVVTVSGRVTDAADVWGLVDLLRKVPGVERVVVGNIREW